MGQASPGDPRLTALPIGSPQTPGAHLEGSEAHAETTMPSKMLSVSAAAVTPAVPEASRPHLERRMESRSCSRMRLSPIPRHCVPIPVPREMSGQRCAVLPVRPPSDDLGWGEVGGVGFTRSR